MSISLKGQIYANTDTAVSDAARRFETSEKKLTWAFVQISTNTQLFGDSSSQPVSYADGEAFELEMADISTLYFKNAAAGQNGTVSIIGVLATY